MDSPPDKLIKALEAHVETLKSQLAEEKARAEKQADDLVAYDTAYAAGLAAERAKAERLIAEFAARDAQHVADLAAERATTERAIAAFTSLADRLDALAAERAKPW
jgi:UDP-N-acetylmuramate-alanine ligase